VFACLDPYAIRDILNHWSWATPQLQLLVVIKVVTAFLTFYYVGLLILALIFRTPFAANGDCTSEASSDGEVAFKIKLNEAIIDLESLGIRGRNPDLQPSSWWNNRF
jgi:hypothetical protein